MGFFDDGLFDDDDLFVEMQLTASSRKEAIELTGDDTFYPGSDELEEDDEESDIEGEILLAGLDIAELEDMDEDERRKVLENAGIDPDDFEFEFG